MQKLYDQYKDQGLQIIGFPCNQFAEQEPGASPGSRSFCQINYGVKFPMFSKLDVNGEGRTLSTTFEKIRAFCWL